MPRGYELTSYYDAMRAVHRKIYSNEIKILSGEIKKFGYLNNNLYSLVISSLNNGLEDNLGDLTQYMHHISRGDIGVNQSSRVQDFMSPLELRINSLAVRKAVFAISKLKRPRVEDMQRVCYEAGQSVGLEFQDLKIGGKKGEFKMSIDSPVLSTKPIIKKFNKALTLGTYPKGEPIEYKDRRSLERKDLVVANKNALAKLKGELVRLGMWEKKDCKNALKMLNIGYYSIEDPKVDTLEVAMLLFQNFDENTLYHTELCMNLEKLTMAVRCLQQYNTANGYTINKAMYQVGENARNQVVATYKMLPEMFSGFYNAYAQADRINEIRKEQIEQSKRVKPNKNLEK